MWGVAGLAVGSVLVSDAPDLQMMDGRHGQLAATSAGSAAFVERIG